MGGSGGILKEKMIPFFELSTIENPRIDVAYHIFTFFFLRLLPLWLSQWRMLQTDPSINVSRADISHDHWFVGLSPIPPPREHPWEDLGVS